MKPANIIFNGVKTGAEIWEIIKHPELEILDIEKDYVKDKLYYFTQYDSVNSAGVITTESKPVPTETELQNALLEQQLMQIKTELSEATIFNNITEIERCQQAYRDLNNGILIQTKTELEIELAEAEADAERFLGMIMDSEGVW